MKNRPLKGPFQQAFYTTTPTENISLELIRKTRQIQKIKTTWWTSPDYKINVKVVSRYIALGHDTYREPPYRYCIDISPYRLIPTNYVAFIYSSCNNHWNCSPTFTASGILVDV